MTRPIVLFEDAAVCQLYPLTLNRPVYDLRCGILTLGEKITREYPDAPLAFHARDYLAARLAEQREGANVNHSLEGEALLINGRALWSPDLAKHISLDGTDALFVKDDVLIAARLSGDSLQRVNWSQPIQLSQFHSIPQIPVQANIITYPWDLIYSNAQEIEADSLRLGCNGSKGGRLYAGVHLLAPERITVAHSAQIKSGAVIDAENGPVFIDEGAVIYPLAYIQGPAYIGKGSWVMVSAKLYEGVSLGNLCKVGGELEQCVIHSYTNKRHDGFLGHAYLGEWVNLGADTNNSNLKNNYGTVSCTIAGKSISTGKMFMGLVMGDHSKAGINTMFNTGTVAGFSCNLFGADFLPKSIPSYSWGGASGFAEYQVEKAIENARRCVHRKQMEIGEAEAEVFRTIFSMTQSERSRSPIS